MRVRPGADIAVGRSGARPDAWASRCRTVAPGGPAGSSSDTSPRSAPTITAHAVTGFVTDAQGRGASSGPRDATTPSASTTAIATVVAPQPSTASSTLVSN